MSKLMKKLKCPFCGVKLGGEPQEKRVLHRMRCQVIREGETINTSKKNIM